jgi:hypothetical protein
MLPSFLVLQASYCRQKETGALYMRFMTRTEERISESACAASSEPEHDAGTDESPCSASSAYHHQTMS